MKDLKENRVPTWSLVLRRCELRNLDSPMGRPRCFLIGLHPKMEATVHQTAALEQPYKSYFSLTLCDYLVPEARPQDFENLTVRQQTNVMQYEQMYHEKIKSRDAKDSVFATVASGRDRNKAIGSQLVFDGLATL